MSKKTTFAPVAGLLRSRKLIVVGVVVFAMFGCGVAASSYFAKKNAAPLNTVTVTQGDIEKTVTSLGKLKPKDYVDVGTQVSGQLKKVQVAIGDRVNKGDLIAEVDATVYETKIRTGRANLENLRAQLVQQQAEASLAQLQFDRNRDLLKERAISQETVEANQSALQVAKAKVAATQAQIKAAQATLDGDTANLGYTKIYAPMAGTVVSQTTLQGQTVNANQAAPVIVRVANLDTMTVWAQVAEADITKVKAGAPAYFTTLGNAERRWKGTVRQVMPTPETVNDVVLYNVLVDVDNRQQALMTDMTVQVFFVLDEARDALLVPLAALQPARGKDPSLYRARVAMADGVAERTVKVGVTNRTTAAVLSGLNAGDKVVVAQASPAQAGAGRNAGNTGGRQGARAMGPRL
ncbi:efflux RND transporter periplasmic adaptor subunit [Noviherbaspirillum sedimenti]|uniref:Efflux RND transporter periplasmic adaptor subunit n=1 Tax=Noviherbaspirillum sedimenti TaxID=2320865 RepID=A0A3A3G2W3_9BURK|nr:efflux RND transporter periplasmic adaptor subunit [Noviherbaspirillum sedimenti]RJG02823.1 efflux RND transporter periplasmic adaptor subunit [Noviherbaspirillum sedimenti]